MQILYSVTTHCLQGPHEINSIMGLKKALGTHFMTSPAYEAYRAHS
jgi:hypothetical protein